MKAPISKAILLAVALLALGRVPSARANALSPRAATVPTIIDVDPLPTFAIGDQPVVVAHLKKDSGAPLPNRMVRIFAYKNRVAEGITDNTGTARIPLSWNFYPGDYKLLVTFNGSTIDHLDSTFTTRVLTIVPGTLGVQSVPALAGVQFKLGDQVQTTDASGFVQFSINHNGGYHIEVVPPAPAPDANVRILFDRWNDNDVSQYHEFKFPSHRVIQAGFLLSYPVKLQYADKANQPVDPGRITFARVRTAGTFYTLTDPGHAWLPNNSILHRVGGILESKQALYYLDNVTIAGANVVNQGQQRFQVGRDSTWRIELFLYPASFSAKDALFRFPVGSGILLEYPDGTKQQLAFQGPDASIQVPSLPRGIYHASVQGTRGLEPRIPLSLSRARGFELIVISRLDFAVLLGVPAAIALLFLIFGRTPLLAWLTPRRRRSQTGTVSS
jgi:hypothetical protein